MFYVLCALTGVMLTLTVFFFFLFDIPKSLKEIRFARRAGKAADHGSTTGVVTGAVTGDIMSDKSFGDALASAGMTECLSEEDVVSDYKRPHTSDAIAEKTVPQQLSPGPDAGVDSDALTTAFGDEPEVEYTNALCNLDASGATTALADNGGCDDKVITTHLGDEEVIDGTALLGETEASGFTVKLGQEPDERTSLLGVEVRTNTVLLGRAGGEKTGLLSEPGEGDTKPI